MREIQLTRGQVAVVDDDDYERINRHAWQAAWSKQTKSFYAIRTIQPGGRPNPKKTVRMHREVVSAGIGTMVDHRNHDTLDNRKKNLRVCGPGENSRNQRLSKNSRSGYKGVSMHHGKWQVRIMVNGRPIAVGRALTAREGAILYNEAARKYHGEYAMVNQIRDAVVA